MMERITSRKNPFLQQVRRLLGSRRARQEANLFVADGTKLLQEAVSWYPGLETVILTDGVETAPMPAGVRVVRVPPDVMESISPMQAPQGALFLCRYPGAKELTVLPGTLILDGIQDPGNLGGMLRTADALDVPVVLTEDCADPFGWKAVRASMGALFRNPPVSGTCEAILAACQKSGSPLAVTSMSACATDIRTAPLSDWAVVIGSEGQGVRREFLEASSQMVTIPMNHRCESLNAAAAATIVMWQMRMKTKFIPILDDGEK